MSKKLVVKITDIGVYNKKNLQLANLNLKLYENDCLALVGPHGSGKTTIAKLITNELLPSSGYVQYNFDIKDIHKQIGYQFRHNSWPNGFKTKDIVKLFKYIHNVIDDEWYNNLIETFNLAEIWNRQISSCSYVWHQIISMFLAVLRRPKVLIVDAISSTHGLDEKIKIINFLKNIKQKIMLS
ncbi:ABC transporter ATP-binding protein [Spiroplasma clarkii]|uniref:ATP-binding cassette domain-containing protein n=1 Tax=Spiroplasma clarkii TaxID=2139 RepID=UPI000B56457A|nr:ATP-binding cassette domain-containing protein [Spiroplasma clarkii]ARU92245.1 ABC transporter ATP-binding protein [Spiroplasma clarkii]